MATESRLKKSLGGANRETRNEDANRAPADDKFISQQELPGKDPSIELVGCAFADLRQNVPGER